jgi:hypothetical protein
LLQAHNAVVSSWALEKRLLNPSLAENPADPPLQARAGHELLHHHQLLHMIDGYDAERGKITRNSLLSMCVRVNIYIFRVQALISPGIVGTS